MTQHTDLIERLYEESQNNPDDDRWRAAGALEATAKNAFEAMPHDIPQRMKDAICEETGWSVSMVSRMYVELRKAFTGEPYKANEDLDAALLEIEGLRKDAEELAFLDEDLLYWVDRAVGKGNANTDIEEAYARYEAWRAARHEAVAAMAMKGQT